jgi:isomerase DpgB
VPDKATQLFEFEVESTSMIGPSLITRLQELCDGVDGVPGGALVVLRLGGAEAAAAEDLHGVAVRLVNQWEQALRRLEQLRTPTVAVASGYCSGPALEAMLSCDYRVGAAGLRVRLPLAAGEPWPGMVVHRLGQQLGASRARKLVLFGAELTAAQALEIGLIDDVVETECWTPKQFTLADGLLGSELAIRRRLLLESTSTSFEEALGAHLAACDRTLRRVKATP